ncbi:MAG: ABC transporter ATP-binding protein [Candidatus Omnitrophota bacterium]
MIEAKELTRTFNGRLVLNQMNLAVEKGETIVVIGRSGCGKSVFLKHVIGILKPDTGDLLVEGKSIVGLSAKELNVVRLRFGMVFQGSALFDSLSVGENVGFALLEHTKLSHKAISERVEESLELVGLKGIQDLRPSELSGGMKKRVAFARAICNRPEIVLYDEPTTGLDPIMADAINDLILEMKKKLSVTSIVVTHDMVSAYKIASRIAMLYQGQIIQSGTPDEIRNTSHPVVRQFISGSAVGPMTDIAFKSFGQ